MSTPRCILRAPAYRDADAFAESAGDKAIAQWMLNFPSPFPVSLVRQRFAESWTNIRQGKAVSLVAIEKSTGALVGGVALNNIRALPQPELAYWVTRKRWRQGFGSEMCRAMIAHAFTQRGDDLLRASVLAGNHGSVALLEKLGFVPDGVEQVWAEPYAPTVGMSLTETLDRRQQTGSPLVQISLNRWTLDRYRWQKNINWMG